MNNMIPSSEIRNIKPEGFGFAMLDFFPGSFVVMEECSYDEPYEIARFAHTGGAISRAEAYDKAITKARLSQKYDGSQCDYNVYEETR